MEDCKVEKRAVPKVHSTVVPSDASTAANLVEQRVGK